MTEKKTGGNKKTEAKPSPAKTKMAEKPAKEIKQVKKADSETKPAEPKKVVEKKPKSYKISRSKESSSMGHEKARLEKKKGKFKRQNFGKKKRVPDKWRTPRGIDSGHRIDEKHKPAHPRSGYMTPKKVKGLDVTGYKPIRIFNVAGLEGLDPKTEAILIASAVGMKKRIEIQKAAQQKNIQILNFKE
jgi:large subunit ribosomal protein L32e